MKTKRFRVLSCILATLMFSTAFCGTAYATDENQTVQESIYGLIEDPDFAPEIPETEITEGVPTVIPSSYDPRLVDGVTEVKNQENFGTCWAFCGNATLESAVYKYTGLKSDYSEESMRMILSNSFNSFVNTENYHTGYYAREAYAGDTSMVPLVYFTNRNNPITNSVSWISPNNEIDIPFKSISSVTSFDIPITIDDDDLALFNSSYANCTASDVSYINFDNVKYEIMKHGGVCTSFSANEEYVNLDNGSFNNLILNISKNHSIELIGWNDNYSKNNFKSNCIPENDGAFLFKNSWGTSWGENGFGWISYEDVSLNYFNTAYAIESVDKVSKNEYTLAYDYLPPVEGVAINLNSNESSACMANVYDVSDLAETYGTIDRVTFYTKSIGSFYKVYIVPLSGDNFTMPTMSQLGSVKASGTVRSEGYITADFSTPYQIAQNADKIAVVVKYTVDRDEVSTIYLAKENRNYLYDPRSYPQESYKYVNGVWTDVSGGEESNYGNFCIRPTLQRRVDITQNSTLSANQLYYTGSDVTVDLNLNGNLLYTITESGGSTLYEDNQFTRTQNSVTFNAEYFSNLNVNESKVIHFEFTDGENQTLTITRKNEFPSVSVSGKTAVGQTLTAVVDTTNENSDEIQLQWQKSENGTDWTDIASATGNTYVLTNDVFLKYIRVKASSTENSSYIYPTASYSQTPETRVVIYGDANLDGVINQADATYLQSALSSAIELDAEHMLAGDLNGDGKISIKDVGYINKYIEGIITTFPVE